MATSPGQTEDIANSMTPLIQIEAMGGSASPRHSEAEVAEEMEQASAMDDSWDIGVKEQDIWLPIANVARIMKSALPDDAKIAKQSKECMQECVSEFIGFITSEASEKCQQEKRKTVNGEDILFAMTSLGFENYAESLKIYLSRYRETFIASSHPTAESPLDSINDFQINSRINSRNIDHDSDLLHVKGFPKLSPYTNASLSLVDEAPCLQEAPLYD